MAPPTERQPVVAGRAGGRAREPTARRCWPRRRRSRPRAASAPRASATASPFERAGRPVGPVSCGRPSGRRVGADHVGEVLRARRPRRRRRSASTCTSQPVGHEVARLLRVGEERHRRLRVDEHEVPQSRRAARSRTRRGSRGARPPGGRRPVRVRAGNVSHSSLAPVAPATRPAATSPASRTALPPTRSAAGSPERSALAAASTASSATAARRPTAAGGAGSAPSLQLRSAGRTSVATWPGGPSAAATASAASRRDVGGGRGACRSSPTRCGRRCRCRTAAARRTASDRWRGRRRCSAPGCAARRALWRLASPLPSPGPRWSSTAAGRSAIRP